MGKNYTFDASNTQSASIRYRSPEFSEDTRQTKFNIVGEHPYLIKYDV
jgi:hypothetical protein